MHMLKKNVHFPNLLQCIKTKNYILHKISHMFYNIPLIHLNKITRLRMIEYLILKIYQNLYKKFILNICN